MADEERSGRSGRWRWWLAGTVLVAALGAVWFFWLRVEYHLSVVRDEGHCPSSSALEQMGPSVLPRLYEEIAAAGDADVGEYRETLVAIIQDIRYDIVADRVDPDDIVTIWEEEATVTDVDEAMARALAQAFLSEPNAEQRRTMLAWTGELDFAQSVRFFCDVFPHATPDERFSMDGQLGTRFLRRDEKKGSSYYPWRDKSPAEIERTQREMVRQLNACAVPLILSSLRDAPRSEGTEVWDYMWMSNVLRALTRISPWDKRIRPAIVDALPHIWEWTVAWEAVQFLERTAPSPAWHATPGAAPPADPTADPLVGELLAVFEDGATPESRKAVDYWTSKDHVTTDRVMAIACGALATADRKTRSQLLTEVRIRLDTGRGSDALPPCLPKALLSALEGLAPEPGDWMGVWGWAPAAMYLLEDWDGWDDASRARVRAMIDRTPDKRFAELLTSLLPAQPTPSE